jgi:hypothetical protein
MWTKKRIPQPYGNTVEGFFFTFMEESMEEKKRSLLLRDFLRQYRRIFTMFGVFTVLFIVVFSLYDLEMEAIIYAVILCAVAAVIVLTVRFHGYCRAYEERRQLWQAIEIRYKDLPEAATPVEDDYQQMIRRLGKINEEHLTKWQEQRQESLDYYTTWVHQIKTPIAVMRMNLRGQDTEENRELLAELFRIEQYVDMVLSYIRLGSEQNDLVIQEYDLDAIIRQAIRKYAPQFVRRKIRLVYEPVDMRVLTDEKWLLFILEQLLSNAVKYTPGGTVTISVSPEQVLSVSDTGIGIAPEDLPRIFEKGFTGYNGRSDKKATGLGLYLCRQTAAKLGIHLSAVSQPGKGSTFSLDLYREPFVVE